MSWFMVAVLSATLIRLLIGPKNWTYTAVTALFIVDYLCIIGQEYWNHQWLNELETTFTWNDNLYWRQAVVQGVGVAAYGMAIWTLAMNFHRLPEKIAKA